ncbi:hypothetical protein AB0395_22700 [Streptosporangium sp. NPDC051023]|uniref:hypothetical protein n=1 Tax=Streptosporangium sp. NPDC051023 TaxID=3155410 RepID=UPI00345098F6
MRTFASIAAATSIAAALVAVTGPTADAQAAPAFSAYHGVTGEQQTERFTTLRGQGYRPITFTVDDASSPRYGAVWVKESGPAWAMIQGMSPSGYQKRFNDYLAQGYRPTTVSATGSGDDAVFAAIFEKVSGKFFAKHGIGADQFAAANADAARRGYVLTAANVYGTADEPRYAGVWTQGSQAWSVTTGKTFSEHHAEFLTRTKNGEKPSLVTVGPGETYTTVWVKDGGPAWYEYTGMTSSGYQKRFDELKAKGFFPTQLDVEEGRYTALWAKS